MGTAERREREKEALQTRILEAARDILSEEGLEGLSMRAIADRIEYSPGTIYTYFRDKDELIRAVVYTGFQRLDEYTQREIAASEDPSPIASYGAMGRAYARFALENTAYFRVMFELPAAAQIECPQAECAEGVEGDAATEKPSFNSVICTMQRAVDSGMINVPSAAYGAIIGWGLIHGMTSLYLSGHLREMVQSHEAFLQLVEQAQASLYNGWKPAELGSAQLPAGADETMTVLAS